MPGIWDCHVHFPYPHSKTRDFPDFEVGAPPETHLSVASSLLDLEQMLLIGVTSVREVGGPFGQVRAGPGVARAAARSGVGAGDTIGRGPSLSFPMRAPPGASPPPLNRSTSTSSTPASTPARTSTSPGRPSASPAGTRTSSSSR